MNIPADVRLVLPSPNGATLSLETGELPTFTGCLRNAQAVAQALQGIGPKISLIPAGERWKDGSLRPAVEACISQIDQKGDWRSLEKLQYAAYYTGINGV